MFVRREALIDGERNNLASHVTGPLKVHRYLPYRALIQPNSGYEDDVSIDGNMKAPRKCTTDDLRTENHLYNIDTEK